LDVKLGVLDDRSEILVSDWQDGSQFWREHLAFRDYLRADQAEAVAYACLKYELAARVPRNREAYINGKTRFVREILAKAGV
jgi:GrpB-like predicted nucleotidyltransferase (UPF0157 family)